jgi:hypothetical protein
MQSYGKAVVAYFDLILALTTVALYFMYYNFARVHQTRE